MASEEEGGPKFVVTVTPWREFAACIFVQKPATPARVETFDIGILLGLTRIDVAPVNVVLVRPPEDQATDDALWLAIQCTPARRGHPCILVSANRQKVSRRQSAFTAKIRNGVMH